MVKFENSETKNKILKRTVETLTIDLKDVTNYVDTMKHDVRGLKRTIEVLQTKSMEDVAYHNQTPLLPRDCVQVVRKTRNQTISSLLIPTGEI